MEMQKKKNNHLSLLLVYSFSKASHASTSLHQYRELAHQILPHWTMPSPATRHCPSDVYLSICFSGTRFGPELQSGPCVDGTDETVPL